MNVYLNNLEEHIKLFDRLAPLNAHINQAIALIVESLQNKKKLMICGNGGSAADSQHLAAEFTGRFVDDRPPIAAMSLSTDTSALTCISNDYSFSDVFSRQVQALGISGDCLMAISTSGNSENVISAVIAANALGIKTIGLLGRDGGKLKEICECSIIVPSLITARIQEAHILICHSICGAVEIELGFAK